MNGNIPVQFLGEGVTVTSPPYPTPRWETAPAYPTARRNSFRLRLTSIQRSTDEAVSTGAPSP
jgi:hypothetical protein